MPPAAKGARGIHGWVEAAICLIIASVETCPSKEAWSSGLHTVFLGFATLIASSSSILLACHFSLLGSQLANVSEVYLSASSLQCKSALARFCATACCCSQCPLRINLIFIFLAALLFPFQFLSLLGICPVQYLINCVFALFPTVRVSDGSESQIPIQSTHLSPCCPVSFPGCPLQKPCQSKPLYCSLSLSPLSFYCLMN